MITIFPAIDLKGGKCVRLRQGAADDVVVYGDDPVATALRFQSEGAKALHVVDLDGAFEGAPAHAQIVAAITAALSIPVEVGGGLRTDEHIRTMIEAGVMRVILGTRALADAAAVKRLVDAYGGEKIAVGIDARDGFVQVKGWVETTSVKAVELARRLDELGVGTIIYTDTATDGMLTGPNLEAVARICDAVSCNVTASGGISSPEDIMALVALGKKNLTGVIVGKAIYEGRASIAAFNRAAEP